MNFFMSDNETVGVCLCERSEHIMYTQILEKLHDLGGVWNETGGERWRESGRQCLCCAVQLSMSNGRERRTFDFNLRC